VHDGHGLLARMRVAVKAGKPRTSKLALHPETVRQLSSTTLGDIGGGLGPRAPNPIGAVWSDGKFCTGDPFCTGMLGCSRGCA
jgi:hypothetical protein